MSVSEAQSGPQSLCPAASPPHGWPRWREGLALGLVLLLAAGLRIYHLGHHSLWVDELLSLRHSAGCGFGPMPPTNVVVRSWPDVWQLERTAPWWSAWQSVKRDVTPPIYFLLLGIVRQVFGPHDVVARSLSLLASLATIVLLFGAARPLHGAGVALWACLLMALASPQIYFAQEARAYALLMALGLGACVAVVRLERLGPGWMRAMAVGACLLGLMLTHYLALGAAAAMGVYAVLRLRGKSRGLAVGAMLAAAAAFLLLWGPGFVAQMGNMRVGSWLLEDPNGHVQATLERWATLPLRLVMDLPTRTAGAMALAAVLYVLPFLLLRRRPELLLWGLWLVATVALVTGLDLRRGTRQLDYIRYTILAGPAAYVLIAALLWRSAGWVRHLLPAAAVAGCLFALPSFYDRPSEDWRELAGYLHERVQPQDAIVYRAASERDWYVTAIPMNLGHYTPVAHRPSVVLCGPPGPEVLAHLRASSGIWVISGQFDSEPLLPQCKVLEGRTVVGVANVTHLAPPPPRPTTASDGGTPAAAGPRAGERRATTSPADRPVSGIR